MSIKWNDFCDFPKMNSYFSILHHDFMMFDNVFILCFVMFGNVSLYFTKFDIDFTIICWFTLDFIRYIHSWIYSLMYIIIYLIILCIKQFIKFYWSWTWTYSPIICFNNTCPKAKTNLPQHKIQWTTSHHFKTLYMNIHWLWQTHVVEFSFFRLM